MVVGGTPDVDDGALVDGSGPTAELDVVEDPIDDGVAGVDGWTDDDGGGAGYSGGREVVVVAGAAAADTSVSASGADSGRHDHGALAVPVTLTAPRETPTVTAKSKLVAPGRSVAVHDSGLLPATACQSAVTV